MVPRLLICLGSLKVMLASRAAGMQDHPRLTDHGARLGIWERLSAKDPSPEAEWVTLAGDQARFERIVDGVRVWRFPDGDALGVYFIPKVPDLPQAGSPEAFVARYTELVSSASSRLVECEFVDLRGFRALRAIVKVPQAPTGMTYVGSVTIPFSMCSYVLVVQCEERGTTGIREAMLVREAFRDGATPEEAEEVVAHSADAAAHDARFPDHPVTRARKHLAFVVSAIRMDDRLRSVEAFGLP